MSGLPVDASRAVTPLPFALAIAEGFCPYGHGPLVVNSLHGKDFGSCPRCGCSWRSGDDGVIWGVACVPGEHHCKLRWGGDVW
jgi:hypothetical protein